MHSNSLCSPVRESIPPEYLYSKLPETALEMSCTVNASADVLNSRCCWQLLPTALQPHGSSWVVAVPTSEAAPARALECRRQTMHSRSLLSSRHATSATSTLGSSCQVLEFGQHARGQCMVHANHYAQFESSRRACEFSASVRVCRRSYACHNRTPMPGIFYRT